MALSKAHEAIVIIDDTNLLPRVGSDVEISPGVPVWISNQTKKIAAMISPNKGKDDGTVLYLPLWAQQFFPEENILTIKQCQSLLQITEVEISTTNHLKEFIAERDFLSEIKKLIIQMQIINIGTILNIEGKECKIVSLLSENTKINHGYVVSDKIQIYMSGTSFKIPVEFANRFSKDRTNKYTHMYIYSGNIVYMEENDTIPFQKFTGVGINS